MNLHLVPVDEVDTQHTPSRTRRCREVNFFVRSAGIRNDPVAKYFDGLKARIRYQPAVALPANSIDEREELRRSARKDMAEGRLQESFRRCQRQECSGSPGAERIDRRSSVTVVRSVDKVRRERVACERLEVSNMIDAVHAFKRTTFPRPLESISQQPQAFRQIKAIDNEV